MKKENFKETKEDHFSNFFQELVEHEDSSVVEFSATHDFDVVRLIFRDGLQLIIEASGNVILYNSEGNGLGLLNLRKELADWFKD